MSQAQSEMDVLNRQLESQYPGLQQGMGDSDSIGSPDHRRRLAYNAGPVARRGWRIAVDCLRQPRQSAAGARALARKNSPYGPHSAPMAGGWHGKPSRKIYCSRYSAAFVRFRSRGSPSTTSSACTRRKCRDWPKLHSTCPCFHLRFACRWRPRSPWGCSPQCGRYERTQTMRSSRLAAAPHPRPKRERARKLIVVAEISASVVLLIGGGLLLRSLTRLLSVDPGFRTENVLTFSLVADRRKIPRSGRAEQLHSRQRAQYRDAPGG